MGKSWNVVLNMFVEIKGKAAAVCDDLWAYKEDSSLPDTCIEYWATVIGDQKYIDIIHYLKLMEFNDFLQIGYGNYSDVLSGETDVTMDSMWDLYDGLFRECRAVVIDIKNECLVLTPFKKFRNLNEGDENAEENILKRISEASCVEFSNKLDGSMQSARCYHGEIVMAGSQSLDRTDSWRLADGYRMLNEKEGYIRMLKDDPDKTFIFEYISKKDAHVVDYDVEGLFLIGVRDVGTGKESSYAEVLDYAAKYDIPATEVFDTTLDDIIRDRDTKKGYEAEGFVANIDGYKVKIKYNDYMQMHKLISKNSSVNLIIKMIADGVESIDDELSMLPRAYQKKAMSIANAVIGFKNRREAEIEEYYSKAPKDATKAFMIWVTENVPKEIQGYLRCKYRGEPYNVLKGRNRYLKLNEMGVEKYDELFEE